MLYPFWHAKELSYMKALGKVGAGESAEGMHIC